MILSLNRLISDLRTISTKPKAFDDITSFVGKHTLPPNGKDLKIVISLPASDPDEPKKAQMQNNPDVKTTPTDRATQATLHLPEIEIPDCGKYQRCSNREDLPSISNNHQTIQVECHDSAKRYTCLTREDPEMITHRDQTTQAFLRTAQVEQPNCPKHYSLLNLNDTESVLKNHQGIQKWLPVSQVERTDCPKKHTHPTFLDCTCIRPKPGDPQTEEPDVSAWFQEKNKRDKRPSPPVVM